LLNGESYGMKKQRMWKKDILRQNDTTQMKDLISKLRKHRQNENGGQNSAVGHKSKALGARTSIQQTQAS